MSSDAMLVTSDEDEGFSSAESVDAQRLQELIDSGADVNAKDAAGETAVLKADRAGHEDAVLVLIRGGAPVTDLPTESWTMEHVGYTPRVSCIIRFLFCHSTLPCVAQSIDFCLSLAGRTLVQANVPVCC